MMNNGSKEKTNKEYLVFELSEKEFHGFHERRMNINAPNFYTEKLKE